MRYVILLAVLATACEPEPSISIQETDPPLPTGTAQVTPERLDFLEVPFDTPVVQSVELTNVGVRPLQLRGAVIRDGDGVLTTDEQTNAGRRIDEDASYEILVVCRYRERPMAPVEATLVVQTNDRDTPSIDVPLTCTPAIEDTDADTD